MTNIKPNSIEAVMFFALYICAQDKKIAKEEKKELILDIQVMRKLYFDIYGEFIDDNFKEVINSIDIDDKTLKPFISKTLTEKEKVFISNLLTIVLMLVIKNFIIDDTKILTQIEENKKKPLKVGGFRARLQKALEEAEKQKKRREQ